MLTLPFESLLKIPPQNPEKPAGLDGHSPICDRRSTSKRITTSIPGRPRHSRFEAIYIPRKSSSNEMSRPGIRQFSNSRPRGALIKGRRPIRNADLPPRYGPPAEGSGRFPVSRLQSEENSPDPLHLGHLELSFPGSSQSRKVDGRSTFPRAGLSDLGHGVARKGRIINSSSQTHRSPGLQSDLRTGENGQGLISTEVVVPRAMQEEETSAGPIIVNKSVLMVMIYDITFRYLQLNIMQNCRRRLADEHNFKEQVIEIEKHINKHKQEINKLERQAEFLVWAFSSRHGSPPY